MPLTETLVLDIAKAQQGIDRIEAELMATAQRFKVGLADALSVLGKPVTVDADTRGVTTAIDAAVDAADTTVAVTDIQAAPVTSGIDAAVDAADTTVAVTAETGGLGQARAGLEAISDEADEVKASVDRSSESFGSLASVAKVALGAVAVKATLSFLKESVDVASNLAEQLSAVEVVFGSSRSTIEKFASTSADSLGLARDETLELANGVGGLLVGLKLTETQAASFGTQLIQRAADVASLRNVAGGAAEVLQNFQSAIVGEAEPVRKFGVVLNEAAVATKAVELGLGGVTGELTEAQKVQARYALILEGTSVAAGNFALTSDGLANSTRTLSARFRDARSELGEQLLPAALDLVDVAQSGLIPAFSELAGDLVPLLTSTVGAGLPILRGMLVTVDALTVPLELLVSVIDAIPEPLLGALGTFLAFRTAIGPLPGIVASVSTSLSSAGGLAPAFASLVSPIGLAAAGLAVGVSILGAHRKAQEESRKALEEGRKAFLESAEATEKYVESLVRGRIESKNQSDDLTRVGLSLEQYRELLDGGRVGLERFLSILAAGGEITQNDRRLLLGLTDANVNYRASVSANIQGNAGLVKSFQAQQKALQDQAKAALDTLTLEGRLQTGTALAIEALNRREDGTVDYVAAVKEANELVRQQALAEIAAGTATEAARAKNAALKTVYDELALVLKETTEGTTASETALSRYGPALGAAVDQYVRGKPSIEGLAAIQRQFGIDTELLSGVIDDHTARLAEAKAANEAWVKAGVEGLTSITEAGKILDEDTSFQKYINRLQKTAQEQVAFSDNVAKLIARGADDIARNLLEQGISAAGFAAELTRTGDKRLAAQETQVEKTKATFTRAETIATANGTALVNITTATNTAISNAPPPDIAGPITRGFPEAVTGVKSRFADFQRIAATGGDDAGGAFALGFADGIRQRAPSAAEEAASLARKAVREAKFILKAFSPSRVMMDLGSDVAEGLALGIAADTALVEQAAQRMALAAIPSLGSVTAPAVASVVVADAVARPGSSTSSPAAGPAVTIGAGGALLHIGELVFPPGANADEAIEALRGVVQNELVGALSRVGVRVDMVRPQR